MTIQHYHSETSGNVPPSLVAGRIGINTPDSWLFYRDASGAVAKRYLLDYGVVVAKGEVANVANLILSIDPAVIGVMRGFWLAINDAVCASNAELILRFGDASAIASASSSYNWALIFGGSSWGTVDYDNDSGSTESIAFYLTHGLAASGTGIDSEVLISTNDPTPTMFRRAVWRTGYRLSGGSISYLTGSGWRDADMDITRIQILASTGNITKMKYTLTGLP